MSSSNADSCSACRFYLWMAIILIAFTAFAAWKRFSPDVPVTYSDPIEHFKYGSTGGERNMGFPYWIWKVLPEVCADYLPGKGFESLGFLYEPGKDLPVGMSKRRHMGIDRVFLNCAVCHSSTVRVKPDAEPKLVLGMPANRFDLMGFQKFIYQCMADRRFTPTQVVPRIEAEAGGLGLLDKLVVYPLGVYLMRDGVDGLIGRLRFIFDEPDWGPGRVDTFNSAKAIFNFPIEQLPKEELVGYSDFPAIWNQNKKRGMQLHWDGNNDKVEERNLSAAFGTGATPKLIDHASMARIEAYIGQAQPPAFGASFPVDKALAAKGPGHLPEILRQLPRGERHGFHRRIRRQGHTDREDRHRSGPARFLHPRARSEPGHALFRRSAVPVQPFPQDLWLCQCAAGWHLAACALSAQWLGAHALGPAPARGQSAQGVLARR